MNRQSALEEPEASQAPSLVQRSPILVTGAHRSGTTWVGQLLADTPGFRYIHEPFSVTDAEPGACAVRFQRWFTYVCTENEHAYLEPFRRMVALHYDLGSGLRAALTTGSMLSVPAAYRSFRRSRLNGEAPLIKDPIAFFSAPWLADRFRLRVVVLIRHPAAFVSSIKHLRWSHPFGHFLEQPLLMRDVLAPFEDAIRRFAAREQPIVDQAILLWRMIYETVRRDQSAHPEWIFVRHEDLASDPISGFREVFGRLGLAFTPASEALVWKYSGANNPAVPAEGAGSPYVVRRDSRGSLDAWKQRLTPDEVRLIRHGTEDVAPSFYADADWEPATGA